MTTVLMTRPHAKEDALASIREHLLLRALDPSVLETLVRASKKIQFRARRPIVRSGDAALSVFILLSGSVRMFHRQNDAEILVKLYKAPGFFGEMEVLANIPFMESVATLEKTDLLVVPAAVFRELVRTQARFAQLLAIDLSRRLCVSSDQQRAIAFNDIEKRLANLLLDYAQLSGQNTDGGTQLGISLSQDAMARDLGVSRKAIAIAISKLKDEGIVAKENARYVVRDLAALAERGRAVLGLFHSLDASIDDVRRETIRERKKRV